MALQARGQARSLQGQPEDDRLRQRRQLRGQDGEERPPAQVRLLLRLPDRQRAADARTPTRTSIPQQTSIAQYQAARYSEDCKVYAPVYRQATLAGISDPENVDPNTFAIAYKDVLAAWKNYLRNYNKGRGVVLIGHSQGAGMLSQLLSSEIEKHRSQRKRLISAILLGGNVTIRKGKDLGGTFKKTPLCHSDKQVGCVIAFSTFNATPPADALFGRTDGPFAAVPPGKDPADYKVACTNPADLGGGSAPLETIARSEPFPGTLGVGITIMYGGPRPDRPTRRGSPRRITTPPGATTPTAPAR